MYLIRSVIYATLIHICSNVSSQQFVYRAGYFGFFDNREYFNSFINDQTIFGSRISGEAGYAFDDHNRIMAGIDFFYEFGSKGELMTPDIIAYYHGSGKKTGIYLGAFPRLNLTSMPFALFTDTFSYYRPVMEGMLLEYRSANFYHNAWIDWTSRQSFDKRETFIIGLSGFAGVGLFAYQHHFIMTHLAHSKSRTDENIRDNAGFAILPGLSFSDNGLLDSLSVYAGILGSYDRVRGIYDFRFPLGFLAEINARYRTIGFHGTVYSGESQVITSGDGFYESDFYCRTDAFWEAAGNGISGRLLVSLHFIPGVTDISMSLVIKASIGGTFHRHHLRSEK
jgi:hypothetical protein